MSKESSMTFRVEPQLRQQFNAAAEADHRPAAQLLREFMRSYVDRVQHKTDSAREIDTRESDGRRADFEAAVASVALEGFSVPADYKAEAERFIRGEIGFDALTAAVHDMARNR